MIKISILEINLNEIKNNISLIKSKMPKNQKFCAVVKANAYGLGAKKVCQAIDDYVDYFAVSSASEFYGIRRYVSKPILILCPEYKYLKRLIEAGAELTISNIESLKKVAKAAILSNKECRVHIAVNTGMNRFGFTEINNFLTAIKVQKFTPNIKVCGVFSHYFEADNNYYTNLQYDRFLDFICTYKVYENDTIFHISASSGLALKNNFDMVRIGISLYSDEFYNTVSLKSEIIDIHNLSVGETAGYDAIFKTKKECVIATVKIGYADGIFKNIAGKGYVLVNGKKAKIVAVCMDSILIDVTNIEAKIEDSVILIGKSGKEQIFVCDIAKWCDTISYEILTKITSRVKRKYIL